MIEYDVVVVGLGPAGGQCARELAGKGFKVLLIDRAKNYLENNYSSGGAPLEILAEYQLPSSLAGTFWNILRINSTHACSSWTADFPFGPVLDFEKLRQFLAEETTNTHGEVQLGCQYLGHEIQPSGIKIELKNLLNQETVSVRSKVLVDATGSERKVLVGRLPDEESAMIATGIEYHVTVDSQIYNRFAHSLNFYLGHFWMPQGYAWIFPMSPNKLKVGVIRYFQNRKFVFYEPSYKFYLNRLLALCNVQDESQILDKHGKTIVYRRGQRDLRCKGPILAIGDAISAINPLGCEGIRHALASGRMAAAAISDYLEGKNQNLDRFDMSMRKYFGWKWFFSEWLILLAGAELAFETENDLFIPAKDVSPLSSKAIALLITYRCIEAFVKGDPPLTDRALSHELGLSLNHLHSLIEILQNERILSATVYQDKTVGYQPARAVNTITMQRVCQAVERGRSMLAAVKDSPQLVKINDYLKQSDAILENSQNNPILYPYAS